MIAKVVNSNWFRSALAGGVGGLLLIEGEVLYAGIAIGIGVREFFLAFKKVENDATESKGE
tara:strand:+ start:399 stop:581 length:183 start_codon:yes stop_codon:yes gene_type:complete